jgi:hypothetical protein
LTRVSWGPADSCRCSQHRGEGTEVKGTGLRGYPAFPGDREVASEVAQPLLQPDGHLACPLSSRVGPELPVAPGEERSQL